MIFGGKVSASCFVFAIIAVSFVFLFGVANGVSAVTCQDLQGTPLWQNNNINCDVTYTENGASGLSECKYRIVNAGENENSIEWTSQSCSGASETFSITITAGATGSYDCNVNGEDNCELQLEAEDVVGNTGPRTSYYYDIDFTPPSASIYDPEAGSPQISPSFISYFLYSDSGGSGLSSCQYKVDNFGVITTIPDWISAGSCSGSSEPLNKTITVGSNLENCRAQGVNACTVSVRATDGAGNVGPVGTRSFDINFIPAVPSEPDLDAGSDTGFSNSDNITNDTTPTFVGTGSVDSIIEIFRDGDSKGTTSVDGSGNWAVTLGSQSVGTSNYTAQACFGSTCSDLSAALSVTIDTFNPFVAFDSPVGGSWYSGDFNVQYDATDAYIHTCKLSTKDGGNDWAIRVTGGSFCGVDKIESIDISSWCSTNGVGICGVKIWAQDKAGNAAETERLFSIDTTASEVDAFSADRTNLNIANPTVTISWTVQDFGGSGLKQVELWRKPPGGIWGDTYHDFDPSVSGISGFGDFQDTPVDGNGTYEYGLHVLDEAGNLCDEGGAGGGGANACAGDYAGAGTLFVEVDKTAPVVYCTPNTRSYSNDSSFPITCSGEGGDIYYTKDGTDPRVASENLYDPFNKPTITGTDETIMFWAVEYDDAGNSGEEIEYYTFGQPPSVSITGAPPDPSNDTIPSFSFSITGSATSSCRVDGGSLVSCSSPYEIASPLGQGDHTFYVSVNNAFGSDSASYAWTIDLTFPSASIDSPGAGSVQIPDSFNATFSYLDSGGAKLSSCEYMVKNNTVTTLDWTTAGSCGGLNSKSLVNIITVGPGRNCRVDGSNTCTVFVRATDGAGNESSETSRSFNIDLNDPPSISSVSDSPDPIAAGSDISFDVYWSDPNGDAVKLFVCKSADGVTGGTCQGGGLNTWCKDVSATYDSPASCLYTAEVANEGANNYYAYVCDNDECSTSSSGSFVVDATYPVLVMELRNAGGEQIEEINTMDQEYNNWVYIFVGDSTDNIAVDGVRFASDDDQDGVLSGVWTDWFSWGSSSGDWDASAKRMRWGFASSGSKEIYAEVQDTAQNSTEGSADIYVNSAPTSAIYRRDGLTYIPHGDDVVGWQNSDFTRDIVDDDTDGTLAGCGGFVQAEGGNYTSLDGRTCDQGNFVSQVLSVGAASMCSDQGEDACYLYARAWDNDGALGPYGIASYNIDWTDPVIEQDLAPRIVQSGVSVTYSIEASDNVELEACYLYVDGEIPADSMEFHETSCVDGAPLTFCPGGTSCFACDDVTLSGTESSDMQVGCFDHYNLETEHWLNGRFGGLVEMTPATLAVDLEAIPASGTWQTQFDLKATVSGTMEGTINYKFDCMADGTWDLEVDGEVASAYTAEDICSYTSEDTYTAKVLVERGTGSAEDTVTIEVLLNAPPSAINLEDNNDEVDYCFAGAPPIILSWDFDDPNLPGDSQTAYRVQVDTNAGFSTPEIDSGKVLESNTSYAPPRPPGLSYDTRYWWRVMVWDETDASSAWATGTSFTTPVHAYPTTDFFWSPLFPSAEEEVQFTDDTVFAVGSSDQSWSWDFGDTGSSTEPDPVHTYADLTSYTVQLIVSDDAGSCPTFDPKVIRVSVPLPEWLEISPF